MIKKKTQKTGIEENFLKMTKDIYDKPTANIIFNSEKTKLYL